ncbi:hypothetical protein FPQ18DRAFT_398833 [Pyronema domesticum]|nr:hypothetical protein FPQ18DRAFT_398833 [Pyronema domesticum]
MTKTTFTGIQSVTVVIGTSTHNGHIVLPEPETRTKTITITSPDPLPFWVYLLIAILFGTALISLVGYWSWNQINRWIFYLAKGKRYSLENEARKVEVGESAAWSAAGSFDKQKFRQGVRERMKVWWRSDTGENMLGDNNRARQFRLSGHDEREADASGAERRGSGRRQVLEV